MPSSLHRAGHRALPSDTALAVVAAALVLAALPSLAAGASAAAAADCSWWYEETAHGSLPGGGAVFVDGEDEVASFYLLAACARTAVVCPNSTFCWWAAYLGRAAATAAAHVAGYVAMPRTWAVSFAAPDIYFPGVDLID